MLKYLLEKEFKQLFRNAFIPRIVFIMPLMVMLILPWAANQEIRHLRLCVVDNDHSATSERLIHKLAASDYFILTLCMGLAAGVYALIPTGHLLTIYLFALIYLFVVSGLGLVISNYSETMQQAMFVMFFFIIVFILMSGLFTPISSMPDWAQRLTVVNPLKYFIQVMRQVYLKGSSLAELTTQLFALSGFAIVLNAWAIISYRKKN